MTEDGCLGPDGRAWAGSEGRGGVRRGSPYRVPGDTWEGGVHLCTDTSGPPGVYLTHDPSPPTLPIVGGLREGLPLVARSRTR